MCFLLPYIFKIITYMDFYFVFAFHILWPSACNIIGLNIIMNNEYPLSNYYVTTP